MHTLKIHGAGFPIRLKDSFFSVILLRDTFHDIKQYLSDHYWYLLPQPSLYDPTFYIGVLTNGILLSILKAWEDLT